MSAKMVINVRAEETDFSLLDVPNPDVQKIIVGESPTDSDAAMTTVPSLPLFETSFEQLTHLFLWNTTQLTCVPGLARKQLVLEIRNSKDLTTIDSLPKTLQTLVLEDCPNLKTLPSLEDRAYPHLIELSLAGCIAIDAAWIDELIKAAPSLQHIDLSRCSQVKRLLPNLPNKLDRLELNGCKELTSLPDPLPLSLRRLGLRGASKIAQVPELRKAIDYVDLALTTSLEKLPRFPVLERDKDVSPTNIQPRTLFLYGSGVLEPPASEHGADLDSNVAMETREYQDEVDLVGKGTVRRCKLLLLGNGLAGKTKLALNLNPHFNKAKKKDGGHYNGTTHGVQFWDWPDYVVQNTQAPCKVNLHTWDFGGQEIYHSTHRLFVSRGSVFVIVWNPDQDGKQPSIVEGYQDIWYPVRYWLDYIHMECPHNRPLVAIVCSHQGKKWNHGNPTANAKLKEQLQAKLRVDIGDEYADRIPLFVLDSEVNIGERRELEQWLEHSVSTVVSTQGTVVPTYWEIAQNMVEEWLPKPGPQAGQDDDDSDGAYPAAHTRLTMDEFAAHLRSAIDAQLAKPDQVTDFGKLRENYKGGEFLTERRIQRTLRFLTHSGWIYWNPSLFESRVIIDQRWALKRVYAALDRRATSPAYKQLVAHQGRFTFANLQEWCWRREVPDKDDQQLIVSFMTSVGVCFPLSRRYGAEDTVYISPTHLPDSTALVTEFDSNYPDPTQDEVSSTQLHRGHWFAILREICKEYGDDATYAKDACLIRGSTYRWNREDKPWFALLRYRLDDEKKGLGGKILISVAGAEISQRLPSLKGFVEQFLPGFASKPSDFHREFHECPEGTPTVFFSYAWDPVGKEGYYTDAVNALEDALMPFKKRGMVKLLRDKTDLKPEQYITEYVEQAQHADLVLIFTSDKYWTSWWCMLELSSVIGSLTKSNKGVDKSVLVIAHETGNKWTVGDIAPIVAHWNNLPLEEIDGDKYPENLPEQLFELNWKQLRRKFISVITDRSVPLTSNSIGLRKVWSPEKAAEIIAWVKQKLGLPTDGGVVR